MKGNALQKKKRNGKGEEKTLLSTILKRKKNWMKEKGILTNILGGTVEGGREREEANEDG